MVWGKVAYWEMLGSTEIRVKANTLTTDTDNDYRVCLTPQEGKLVCCLEMERKICLGVSSTRYEQTTLKHAKHIKTDNVRDKDLEILLQKLNKHCKVDNTEICNMLGGEEGSLLVRFKAFIQP